MSKIRLRREVDRLTTELASRTKAATDWRDTAERHLARAEVAERGLAAIRRAAEPEPFEKIEQLPSGLTCPGCYAATGIAQPHDPRATLHDGDPQKSGTLAGGGSKND